MSTGAVPSARRSRAEPHVVLRGNRPDEGVVDRSARDTRLVELGEEGTVVRGKEESGRKVCGEDRRDDWVGGFGGGGGPSTEKLFSRSVAGESQPSTAHRRRCGSVCGMVGNGESHRDAGVDE